MPCWPLDGNIFIWNPLFTCSFALTSLCLCCQGRGGKGSIFVWAAGNGGMQRDHCGADGYVYSIYNIATGAVSHTGKPAHFGEPCPGVMAATPAWEAHYLWLLCVYHLTHLTTVFTINEVVYMCACQQPCSLASVSCEKPVKEPPMVWYL